MSQGSSVVWTQHERVTSADLNRMATMASSLSLQGMLGSLITPFGGNFSTDAQARVAGFLVDSDGAVPNRVRMDPRGALWMSSASSPAIPPNDAGWSSNFRFASTLELPTPVTPTDFDFPIQPFQNWYIIEARIVEEAVTGTRDIRNPATGQFAPATVVIANRVGIEFRAIARSYPEGPNNYPRPIPGWTPIAAVRTLPGGGVIANNQIVDLRLVPQTSVAAPFMRRGRFDFYVEADGTIFGSTVDPIFANGIQISPRLGANAGSVDNMSSLVPSPTADTTYYLYAIAPGGVPTATPFDRSRRGIVIASTVFPVHDVIPLGYSGSSGGVWVNNAPIPLSAIPEPYKAVMPTGVDTGLAVLVGAVRRATSDWVPMRQTNGHVEIGNVAWARTTVSHSSFPANGALGPGSAMPIMVRAANYRVIVSGNGSSLAVTSQWETLGADESLSLLTNSTIPSEFSSQYIEIPGSPGSVGRRAVYSNLQTFPTAVDAQVIGRLLSYEW